MAVWISQPILQFVQPSPISIKLIETFFFLLPFFAGSHFFMFLFKWKSIWMINKMWKCIRFFFFAFLVELWQVMTIGRALCMIYGSTLAYSNVPLIHLVRSLDWRWKMCTWMWMRPRMRWKSWLFFSLCFIIIYSIKCYNASANFIYFWIKMGIGEGENENERQQ